MTKERRYIDTELCDTCNGKFLCVKDCVTSFIKTTLSEGKSYASFKERGYCLDCGHCNAICPTGAIKGCSCEETNVFLRFLGMKRTCRNYNKERSIPEESMRLIVQSAQSAPTEKNRVTVSICFIKERLYDIFIEALEVLKIQVEEVGVMHPQYKYIMDLYEKKTPVFWGAEYAVLVIGKPQFTTDAALAAERIQLMASTLGISSGYNGNLKSAINGSESLKEKLGITGDNQVLVSFALGMSDIEYSRPYISEKKKIRFI